MNDLPFLHIRSLVEIYTDNIVIYYGSLRPLDVVYVLISSMNGVNDLLELNNLSLETKTKIDKLGAVLWINWSASGRS